MAGRFTKAQWTEIMALLDADPAAFGMPEGGREQSLVLASFNIRKLSSAAGRERELDFMARFCAKCDLVATDIAARGLDIDGLPHVVNYELPHVPEDYVHRIGRTARAGRDGQAISLVCVDEHKLLKDIERLLKTEIPKEVVAGYEVDPRIKAEPITQGRRQHQAPKKRRAQRNRPKRGRRQRKPA